MLSRISISRIAPTALGGIVPCAVLSRLGHPFPPSQALFPTHHTSYPTGPRSFSTTRSWFRKHRKGYIVGRLLSASGLLSKEQEKALEQEDDRLERLSLGEQIPFAKGFAVYIVVNNPEVATEAENYGDMTEGDQRERGVVLSGGVLASQYLA